MKKRTLAISVASLGLVGAVTVPALASGSSASATDLASFSTVAATSPAPGSVTREVKTTRKLDVKCSTSGSTYTTVITGPKGKRSLTITIPDFKGDGTYSGATAEVKTPKKDKTHKLPAVSVTSSGGSFSLDHTGKASSRTGEFTWTCSA